MLAAGVGIGTVGLNLGSGTKAMAETSPPEWPWPHATLDVEEVRKRGHFYYYEGGCMYGAASALVTSLVDAVGYPTRSSQRK